MICGTLICSCKSTKKSTTQPVPKETTKDFIYDDLANSKNVEEEVKTEEISVKEVTVRTESVKPVDRSEKTLYKYYVIIGSFRSVSNARQYNANLVKEGFSATILENENGLFRISVGGYNEEKAARAQIAEIRAKYAKHRDVWLLKRK